MKNKNSARIIINLIVTFFLCVIVYVAYQYYKANQFNDFVRSEYNLYTSQFKRDDEVKYSKKRSYKIVSDMYNDAMFYKTIKVEKNKPYRVTCMVKTENVEAKEQNSGVGAQISIESTTERSIAIQGTEEWQKIELIFNSKNRETVNIGFRLGGYLGEAKGTAWFSDFVLEEGTTEKDNNWNFACIIFKTTDVNINEKQIKLEVSNSDITDIKQTIKRFENSIQTLSERKIIANCDIYEVSEPITKLSYDEQFGYYVSAENVEEQIKQIATMNNYDHIFAIVRLRR